MSQADKFLNMAKNKKSGAKWTQGSGLSDEPDTIIENLDKKASEQAGEQASEQKAEEPKPVEAVSIESEEEKVENKAVSEAEQPSVQNNVSEDEKTAASEAKNEKTEEAKASSPKEDALVEKVVPAAVGMVESKVRRRRPQKVGAKNPGSRSLDKGETISGEKNLTTSRTFSIDMRTSERLDAAISLLREVGFETDDGRPITASAFVRFAIEHDLERLNKESQGTLDPAIEEEINRVKMVPAFNYQNLKF